MCKIRKNTNREKGELRKTKREKKIAWKKAKEPTKKQCNDRDGIIFREVENTKVTLNASCTVEKIIKKPQ